MTENEEETKSEIALAIERRERKLYPFDVEGFFGLGDKQIPKVRIRVLVKAEENAAIVAAHHRAKVLSRDDSDTRNDRELLDDLKLKEAIQRSCFMESETKGGHPIQAFPGGQWMENNLTTDQIAVLWNMIEEVKKAESPMLYRIEKDEVMALAEGCAKTADTGIPEELLTPCNRSYITTAFVLLACEWWKLKQQQEVVDILVQSKVDGQPERGAGPDGAEDKGDSGDDAGGAE